MAARRAHHGDLDALIAQSSDTSGPFSFDHGPPFELKAELAKEFNRPSEVIDDDSDVVHPFERHVPNLHRSARPQTTKVAGQARRDPHLARGGRLGVSTQRRIRPNEAATCESPHLALRSPRCCRKVDRSYPSELS